MQNDSGPDTAPAVFTQAELATRWRVSPRTLERWRAENYGPAWLLIGGSIRYPLADVLAFEHAQRRGT